jgi:O-acetylhomoserine/O-acetylserine sulfhydrylase-like pyridoxal-dependent enzyme
MKTATTSTLSATLTKLTKPTSETLYSLIDNLQITDYSGKKSAPLKKEKTSPLSILELYLTSIEGGSSALSFHSFDAALSLLVVNLLEEGDNAVTYNSQSFYNKQFTHWGHLGISVKKPDYINLEQFKNQVDERTKFIYLETISEHNEIPDFQKIIAFAKSLNIPVIVDNSIIGPGYGFSPLKEKADLVIYNTKHWLSKEAGPAEALIVENNRFNWFSDQYPTLQHAAKDQLFQHSSTEVFPSLLSFLRRDIPSINYSERQQEYLTNALLNLKTSVLKKYDITYEVEKWLKQNKWVDQTNYVGSHSNNSHFKALTYFQNGYGNYLTFSLSGFDEDYKHFKNLIESKYSNSPLIEFSFLESKKEIGLYVRFGDLKSITELLHKLFDEHKPTGYSTLFFN